MIKRDVHMCDEDQQNIKHVHRYIYTCTYILEYIETVVFQGITRRCVYCSSINSTIYVLF